MDVDQVNSHFEAQMARRPGKPHLLHYVGHRKEVLAAVLEATGEPHPDCPYSVKELFKHKGGGEYWWWDLESCRWMMEGGREALWHVIRNVLTEDLDLFGEW